MSRTIFACGLAAGLMFALGCGSKPEPTQPSVKLEPDPAPNPQPGPPPGAPKVEPPKVVWEMDQSKHAIPATPVRGSMAGVEVSPEAQVEGAELTFRVLKAGTPMPERSVKVRLAPKLIAGQPAPAVLGREWKVKFDAEPGPEVPEIWLEEAGKPPHVYPTGYALTLELGQRKDGKVPGKVYLSLPDEKKTVLAGTFAANYVRPHTEKPGPDDAPYITGAVTVTGAKSGAQVRVGYAGFGPSGVDFKELQIPFDASPPELAQWTRDESEKNTLVSGDGKTRPFRYEFIKLPPGRYLLSVAVVGNPAAWKWVDLPANGMLTENLALDATKTGGVEISAPAGTTGKVHLAPADEGKPPLDDDLFRALSFQIVRQDVEIAGGKALVKNLAPGKYEVRAGELRGTVDVAVGKTTEFALMPPKK